jgi:hypothetical protein
LTLNFGSPTVTLSAQNRPSTKEYYCIAVTNAREWAMLALRGLCEGFARGRISRHTPPLLGRKPSSVKSRVSITSKLIEIKRLQVLYSGHLRKTGGGRGSYRLVHTTGYLARKSPRRKFQNRPASAGSSYTTQEAAALAAGWPRRSIRGAEGAHKSQRYMGECGMAAEFADWAGIPCVSRIPCVRL